MPYARSSNRCVMQRLEATSAARDSLSLVRPSFVGDWMMGTAHRGVLRIVLKAIAWRTRTSHLHISDGVLLTMRISCRLPFPIGPIDGIEAIGACLEGVLRLVPTCPVD